MTPEHFSFSSRDGPVYVSRVVFASKIESAFAQPHADAKSGLGEEIIEQRSDRRDVTSPLGLQQHANEAGVLKPPSLRNFPAESFVYQKQVGLELDGEGDGLCFGKVNLGQQGIDEGSVRGPLGTQPAWQRQEGGILVGDLAVDRFRHDDIGEQQSEQIELRDGSQRQDR